MIETRPATKPRIDTHIVSLTVEAATNRSRSRGGPKVDIEVSPNPRMRAQTAIPGESTKTNHAMYGSAGPQLTSAYPITALTPAKKHAIVNLNKLAANGC